MRKLTSKGAAPLILQRNEVKAVAELENQLKNGITKIKFKSSLYASKSVKNALEKLQNGTCAFCEAELKPVTTGHVEHFRPKAGYVSETTGKLVRPGYYKLAYKWSNLLVACPVCNGIYKKNRFPLENEGFRNIKSINVKDEKCRLINPYLIDPRSHIRFRRGVPYPVSNSTIGKETIDLLGLDRSDLIDARERVLKLIRVSWLLMQSNAAGSKEFSAGRQAYDMLVVKSSQYRSCITDYILAGYYEI